jgi:hypothetical protein
MKTKFLRKMTILLISLVLNACNSNDDDLNQYLNGNYIGIFTVEYIDGTIFTNDVTITFSGKNNYNSSGDGNNNDFYPAGGNGAYEKREATIKFDDTNIWLAHFDWNLILNGEYNYSIDGNYLIISAYKNDIGFYKYELEKESLYFMQKHYGLQ